ncbi:MAG: HD domain-containing phosphohydrolase [Armatimonadota bacterium]
MKPESTQRAVLQGAAIVLAMAAIAALVAIGGTSSIAVHLFYLPILYAGFVFGDFGAIIAAIVAALLCGPWMPSQVIAQGPEMVRVPQTWWDIGLRTALFYVLGIFASRVSHTIKRRATEMRTLYEVARTVSSSLRLRNVLDTIAQQAVSALDARACSIRMLDRERGELERAASSGLSEEYWGKGPVTVQQSALDRRVLAGETVAILNAQTDPLFQYPEAARQEGLTSVLSLPLRSREDILGVMRIYAHRQRRFRGQEVELLSAFASVAAVAIENAELYEESRRGYFETIRALTIAIEARDSATYSHSERVTELADELAAELGLSNGDREVLRFGCILHDIGKIGIEERMLDARDTHDAAHVFYRMHPLIGRAILRPVTFAQQFMPIVLYHHERWDGSGFPQGLEGEQIPYLARLVAVVDSYERAVNPTESPMPVSPREALHSIVRGAGSAYDPEIVAAFEAVMERRLEQDGADAGLPGDGGFDVEALIDEAIESACSFESKPREVRTEGSQADEE